MTGSSPIAIRPTDIQQAINALEDVTVAMELQCKEIENTFGTVLKRAEPSETLGIAQDSEEMAELAIKLFARINRLQQISHMLDHLMKRCQL